MARIPILWMSCDADGGPRLDHAGTMRSIRRALQRSERSEGFHLEHATDLYLNDVEEELQRVQPELLILSTHALAPKGRVLLKDEDGKVRDYPPEVVAERLTSGPRPPRLVVLNTCNSLKLAEALRDRGVHVVIGAAGKLPDEQAKPFLGRLCGALFNGADAGTAFEMAKPTDGTFGARSDGELFILSSPGVSPASLRLRPREAPAKRRVIVLDAYDTPLDLPAALTTLEQAGEEPRVLRLSERWGVQLAGRGWDPTQLSWPQLANAVEALLVEAGADRGPEEELVVVGHAPMAVYAHVGQALSSWSTRWTLLNRRKEGVWDRIDVREHVDDSGALFRAPDGMDQVSHADGWVAVFVSVMAHHAAPDALPGLVNAHLGPCAGVVALLSGEARTLHEDNAEACAAALRALARTLPTRFPRAKGVALFVAGPASLGFLAGRAFNVNQLPLQLWEFRGGSYVPAYALPWHPVAAPSPLPVDAEARLGRRDTLDELLKGVDALRRRLRPEELRIPRGLALSVPDPQALARLLHSKLLELEVDGGEDQEAFVLSVQERRLSFGAGLLHALSGSPASELQRLSQLFVLHELYHYEQGVDSLNYRGVGRAGMVLEEVDYQADAFAVLTATLWEVRRKGEEGEETCGAILQRNLNAVLDALQAFDRMEQGDALHVLPERRLRRYLIWALQLARARTVRRPEDIEALFTARPFVEVAPLRSSLSPTQDKLVEGALDGTQLFVSLGGRLLRLPRLEQNFEPGALVEAVRRMDAAKLVRAMAHVVARHEEVLAPWVRG
ncbi:MAG: SAVED domain-containing protein [Alphaproteobacteria bacterium]|nr:SAVED domain-containing protein [Alphaproteobacteria bacterium]